MPSGHYIRGQSLKDRLMSWVMPEPNSGCWLFVGSLYPNGYGLLRVDGKSKQAHRLSYELHCEPIPPGLNILHNCDVRCCVNPDHLRIGTQRENVADMVTRKRHVPASLPGERNPFSKLSEDDVRYIRASSKSHAALARELGVYHTAIVKVRRRQSWAHI